MDWFLFCIIITCVIVIIRIYLISYFTGFEFKYWGDFVFVMFLIFIAFWYELTVVQFIIISIILLVIRRLLQNISNKRFKDMEQHPKDIIITFKRYSDGPNPYDILQFVSFVIFVFILLYFKPQISEMIKTKMKSI